MRRLFLSIAASALPLAALLWALGCHREHKLLLDGMVVEHPVPLVWTELGHGLAFTRLEFTRQSDAARVMVAVVRAEPGNFDFVLLDSPSLLGRPLGNVDQLATAAGVAVAVNASFYLPETFKPIGLIVSERNMKNEWKKGAGSGVFWVKDGRASIDWSRVYRQEWAESDLALQAGPLVVEPDGRPGIRSNAGKYDARTVVGLDDRHRVVLAATMREDDEGSALRGLDLYELMTILAASPERGGLGLKAALNLDGGTSTALHLHTPQFHLLVDSTHPVRNGIGLRPRKPWK